VGSGSLYAANLNRASQRISGFISTAVNLTLIRHRLTLTSAFGTSTSSRNISRPARSTFMKCPSRIAPSRLELEADGACGCSTEARQLHDLLQIFPMLFICTKTLDGIEGGRIRAQTSRVGSPSFNLDVYTKSSSPILDAFGRSFFCYRGESLLQEKAPRTKWPSSITRRRRYCPYEMTSGSVAQVPVVCCSFCLVELTISLKLPHNTRPQS